MRGSSRKKLRKGRRSRSAKSPLFRQKDFSKEHFDFVFLGVLQWQHGPSGPSVLPNAPCYRTMIAISLTPGLSTSMYRAVTKHLLAITTHTERMCFVITSHNRTVVVNVAGRSCRACEAFSRRSIDIASNRARGSIEF